jgi:hypothetical protein
VLVAFTHRSKRPSAWYKSMMARAMSCACSSSSRANRRVTILPMGGDLPQNKKLEIDAAEFRLCAERRLVYMLFCWLKGTDGSSFHANTCQPWVVEPGREPCITRKLSPSLRLSCGKS